MTLPKLPTPFGKPSITVEKKTASFPETEIPKPHTEIAEEIKPPLDTMGAPRYDWSSALGKASLEEWGGSSPANANLGSDVCCHGAGVQCTTYRTYHMERRPARSPDNFNSRYGHYPRLFMTYRGDTTRVGVMRGPNRKSLGRAGGWTGWDDTRDMFGATFASFEHNMEALLGAFGERPKLPCTESWKLPNLVASETLRKRERRWNARIVAPDQLAPPASYVYTFNAPTPFVAFHIGTKCPTDTKGIIQIWDSDKRDVAETDELKFPEGDSTTTITLRGNPMTISSGYLNINPTYAPKGLTIAEVRTTPPILRA